MIIKLIHWITLDRIFEEINDWIKLTFVKNIRFNEDRARSAAPPDGVQT